MQEPVGGGVCGGAAAAIGDTSRFITSPLDARNLCFRLVHDGGVGFSYRKPSTTRAGVYTRAHTFATRFRCELTQP